MLLCANGGYYTGWTTDPLRRLKQHNAGRGARYTRMNAPSELVYVEEVADHSTALKRELEIKRLEHLKKAALVADSSRNILSTLQGMIEEESSS
jgi:putative endonuclease